VEHDSNRSAALTPEQLALINTTTSALVKETMATMLRDVIGPILREVALTPEKLQALKAPYINESALAREKRESKQTREQELENIKTRQQMQANCLHMDKQGKSAICLIHNYPDRQARGICPLCNDIIHPREWVIGAPDPNTGVTKPFLRPAHKDYKTVLSLESMN
jgi:hypothetical protein